MHYMQSCVIFPLILYWLQNYQNSLQLERVSTDVIWCVLLTLILIIYFRTIVSSLLLECMLCPALPSRVHTVRLSSLHHSVLISDSAWCASPAALWSPTYVRDLRKRKTGGGDSSMRREAPETAARREESEGPVRACGPSGRVSGWSGGWTSLWMFPLARFSARIIGRISNCNSWHELRAAAFLFITNASNRWLFPCQFML